MRQKQRRPATQAASAENEQLTSEVERPPKQRCCSLIQKPNQRRHRSRRHPQEPWKKLPGCWSALELEELTAQPGPLRQRPKLARREQVKVLEQTRKAPPHGIRPDRAN